MTDTTIILPSKPKVVREDGTFGIYEIEGLYPGYGQTLGNSLRRIILSSLPGYAVTSVKIDGVNHEFSTIPGVKEDVVMIIVALGQLRFRLTSDEPCELVLAAKGVGPVTAAAIETPGQVEIINRDLPLFTITDKSAAVHMVLTVEKGLGFVPKELLQQSKVDVGTIALDASFTPVRRVSYEVENMRVNNRTNFNRLRLAIETDGILSPREALEQSIAIMIEQLRAIVGFKEELEMPTPTPASDTATPTAEAAAREDEMLKTRIEDLELSSRTLKALSLASIRTVGGLARKKESDLADISGLGEKGIQEIRKVLSNFGITLK